MIWKINKYRLFWKLLSVEKKNDFVSVFFFKLKILVKFYDDSLDLFWYVIRKSNWKRNV